MTELVTIGWLTIDDIVQGDTVQRDVLGGGALYSAVGARIWNDSVGVHSVTGRRHLDLVRADIEAAGPTPEARWKRMEQLLSEPTLPKDLRATAS